MIFSMTGYGTSRTEDSDLSIIVEVRAVNNRYLKVLLKTPDFLGGLEPDLERLIRQSVSRGAITMTVYCRLLGSLARPPINQDVLSAYAAELGRLAEKLGLRSDLGIADLVALPGVLDEEDAMAVDVAPIRDRVLAAAGAAMKDFDTMRRQEGKTIEADLRRHADELRTHLAEIGRLAPTVVEEYRDRLMERIGLLLKESTLDLAQESLLSEVSVYAERSDVSEELSRMESHLAQFDELLASDQPSGRKLEFVAQELLREANTTGSKSGHPEIGRRIVEIKAAIDRIKEQVQNAE